MKLLPAKCSYGQHRQNRPIATTFKWINLCTMMAIAAFDGVIIRKPVSTIYIMAFLHNISATTIWIAFF